MNVHVDPKAEASALAPNADDKRRHLEHLFSEYRDKGGDGLVELAWTDTTPDDTGKYKLRHARLFRLDRLDELVAEAARLNTQPMCNVYIGAALRHPDTVPFGRAGDKELVFATNHPEAKTGLDVPEDLAEAVFEHVAPPDTREVEAAMSARASDGGVA